MENFGFDNGFEAFKLLELTDFGHELVKVIKALLK